MLNDLTHRGRFENRPHSSHHDLAIQFGIEVVGKIRGATPISADRIVTLPLLSGLCCQAPHEALGCGCPGTA